MRYQLNDELKQVLEAKAQQFKFVDPEAPVNKLYKKNSVPIFNQTRKEHLHRKFINESPYFERA
jgi:hypothetical protein